MPSTAANVAVAIVLIVVLLVIMCAFIWLLSYFGCGSVCCCNKADHEVHEAAGSPRVWRLVRSNQVDGTAPATAREANPLEGGHTNDAEVVAANDETTKESKASVTSDSDAECIIATTVEPDTLVFESDDGAAPAAGTEAAVGPPSIPERAAAG